MPTAALIEEIQVSTVVSAILVNRFGVGSESRVDRGCPDTSSPPTGTYAGRVMGSFKVRLRFFESRNRLSEMQSELSRV